MCFHELLLNDEPRYAETIVLVHKYSRENGDLNQTFEIQIIQFKRTWVGIIIAKYYQKLAYYTLCLKSAVNLQ